METVSDYNDVRYMNMIEWEQTHNADRIHIDRTKHSLFWSIVLSILFIGIFGFFSSVMIFFIATQIIYIVISLDFGILGWVAISSLLCLICLYFIKAIFKAFRESRAYAGYYLLADDYVKVLAYKTRVEERKYPANRIITIEVFVDPDSHKHEVKIVFCADQKKREAGADKVFSYSVSINKERFKYFPIENNIEVPYIWGEQLQIENQNYPLAELVKLADHGKSLLVKHTGRNLAYFYPELHCSCGTINEMGSAFCGDCGNAIQYKIPAIPTFDD